MGSDSKNRWKNRIEGQDNVPPDALRANGLNFRTHPDGQQEAMVGALDELGWLSEVIVNRRTSKRWPPHERDVHTVLDGHLRVELALQEGEEEIPVKYVDLDPDEEALALATFDPITNMAGADIEIMEGLLDRVQTGNARLQGMLSDMAEEYGIVPPNFQPVDEDEQPRLDEKKPMICPECGHEFVPDG